MRITPCAPRRELATSGATRRATGATPYLGLLRLNQFFHFVEFCSAGLDRSDLFGAIINRDHGQLALLGRQPAEKHDEDGRFWVRFHFVSPVKSRAGHPASPRGSHAIFYVAQMAQGFRSNCFSFFAAEPNGPS
jgi:hypothetical protein